MNSDMSYPDSGEEYMQRRLSPRTARLPTVVQTPKNKTNETPAHFAQVVADHQDGKLGFAEVSIDHLD